MNPTGTEAREHGHYFHDVRHLEFIDVYRVCQLFGVEHPALQHALKKVIAAGKRGAKSSEQDAQEAIDSLERYLAMEEEDIKQRDPHFDLKTTYVPGEMWQERRANGDWKDIATRWNGEWKPATPAWWPNVEYRRHPEDKDAEPAPLTSENRTSSAPADPHAELKAIYRPGMRYRWRFVSTNGTLYSAWSYWISDPTPNWASGTEFEIHPDDLPKEPKEEGWITVPDDCMEMPEGLKAGDLISVKHRGGYESIEPIFASSIWWQAFSRHSTRVIAYKIIKPAE